ncbi:adenylate kinase [Legionella brunensis]|uniref:Adenylate kinase n=1 Tax=Legionella brunensis TaxID=29422 RepID=A0A0W0S5F5_9GAMM|nr:adenylate kinase [Legionella brunensis]KTC78337.1 adenylate kinase [Legionella brunensis]
MRLMLLGGPGAGKGTQALKLINYFKIPQISTGDMLRSAIAAGTELGKSAKKVMDAGELVSDEIIIGLVKERLQQADCDNGFLFDGFPRTLPQADALKNAHIKLDHVIEIAVPDDEIISRISGRLVHLPSGRVYHKKAHPPKKDNLDDITGEPLVQRDDDKEETIKQRLAVYHQQTEPLIKYYQEWAKTKNSEAPKFHRIQGVDSVDNIFTKILACINQEKTHVTP